jgi:tRNA modification GTPase
MKKNTPFDTIAAVSTPPGEGGIGIVRLSGDRAFSILEEIFRPHRAALSGSTPRSFSMRLGYIVYAGETIDEVLVSYMKAPHTYTREDVAEINCHGGAVAVSEVLRLVLSKGARLAEPGEFTKRAFINGRIDLPQAEAVLDIVRSKTSRALEAAVNQLQGRLSARITDVFNTLKSVLVLLEANIDFPEEEDVAEIGLEEIKKKISEARDALAECAASYDTGKIIRDGVTTVLSGKPNVGKSSILNAFLRFERAIVTPIPGTTRDVIEEQLNIDGIPFILADTAGITESDNLIEQEGVKRSRTYIERAQLVLMVFDGSEELDERDMEIIRRARTARSIPVINKTDLAMKLDVEKLSSALADGTPFVYVSAKTGDGLKDLEKRMTAMVVGGSTGGESSFIITSARHFTVLKRALEELRHAEDTLHASPEPELLAYDIRSALDILGEFTGEATNNEILDEIFNNFCIGK